MDLYQTIENIKKNNLVDELCNFYMGCKREDIKDLIIITPVFDLNIFNGIIEKVVKISQVRETYNVYLNSSYEFTFLRIGMCAPIVGDIISFLALLENIKFIFIGTAGSLNPNSSIGDIVIPIKAINDSRYLSLNNDVEFNERLYSYDAETLETIQLYYDKNNLSFTIYSTDNLFWEPYLIDKYNYESIDCLDMEISTVFMMSNNLKIPFISIVVISDEPINGKYLFKGIDINDKKKYLESVKNILPKEINKAIEVISKSKNDLFIAKNMKEDI